jgi:hypothetical protein
MFMFNKLQIGYKVIHNYWKQEKNAVVHKNILINSYVYDAYIFF